MLTPDVISDVMSDVIPDVNKYCCVYSDVKSDVNVTSVWMYVREYGINMYLRL